MKYALFFTRSVSLEKWLDIGIFSREKLIYESLIKSGAAKKVVWFTYGVRDCEIADSLKENGDLDKNIDVVPIPKVLDSYIGNFIYSFFSPIIRHNILKNIDVYKTNQTDGAWSALIAKFLYGKILFYRSGYVVTVFLRRMKADMLKKIFFFCAECMLSKYSDKIILASLCDAEYIVNKYGADRGKIEVITNYVDTDLFNPFGTYKVSEKILYVGRLSRQKNLFNLVDVFTVDFGFSLDIYGDGPDLRELTEYVKKNKLRVSFFGKCDNRKLPEIYNKYFYYILPSLFEGTPKTLLEAMSCGLVVAASDVEGVNNIIKDGINGFLIKGVDSESIKKALVRAVSSDLKEISRNARNFIVKNYSLEVAVKKEVCLIKNVFKGEKS